MTLDKRLERLEKQLISEPTILFMPDGKTVHLAGPRDYLLTLVGLATDRQRATPIQSAHLDLIQKCSYSREPGGSRLVELIQCCQHGPAKDPAEAVR